MGHARQSTEHAERDTLPMQSMLPIINVLVIDDDEDTRELIAAIIENAGYSVETAANGHDALACMFSKRPELILLDIQMPVLDGACFRQEQRRNPEWIRIPTVVITGSNEEPQLDPAIVATLRKPVRGRDYLDIVKRHCTRARTPASST